MGMVPRKLWGCDESGNFHIDSVVGDDRIGDDLLGCFCTKSEPSKRGQKMIPEKSSI